MSDYKMNALEQKLFDTFCFIGDKDGYVNKPLSDMCVNAYNGVRPEVLLSALACGDRKHFADIADILSRQHGLKLSKEANETIKKNTIQGSIMNDKNPVSAYKRVSATALPVYLKDICKTR